jgi:hypothetical protein
MPLRHKGRQQQSFQTALGERTGGAAHSRRKLNTGTMSHVQQAAPSPALSEEYDRIWAKCIVGE